MKLSTNKNICFLGNISTFTIHIQSSLKMHQKPLVMVLLFPFEKNTQAIEHIDEQGSLHKLVLQYIFSFFYLKVKYKTE